VSVTALNLLVLWLMTFLSVQPWSVVLFLGWWLLVHSMVAVYLVANKAAYGVRLPLLPSVFGASVPARGDVIVFLFPEDRERMFIKRVIALPGEEVEVREKTVYIEGRALVEPYARFGAEYGLPRYGFGPERVPADSLFVLGDNRDNSRDSRFWGFLPLADVRGRATTVYFSWDKTVSRVRWDRIGRAIR
jgi:signal peptidase I